MFNNLSRRKFLIRTGCLVSGTTIAGLPSYAISPLKPDKTTRKRLLFVNNNLGFLLMIKDYFEYRGYDSIYDIVTAEDSEEALEVLNLDIPDLIVSDVMLPGINADFTLLKNIRQIQRTRSVPFMFLTSKILRKDVIEGFSIGADAYMVMPVELEKLEARVEVILKQRFHRPLSTKAIMA